MNGIKSFGAISSSSNCVGLREGSRSALGEKFLIREEVSTKTATNLRILNFLANLARARRMSRNCDIWLTWTSRLARASSKTRITNSLSSWGFAGRCTSLKFQTDPASRSLGKEASDVSSSTPGGGSFVSADCTHCPKRSASPST